MSASETNANTTNAAEDKATYKKPSRILAFMKKAAKPAAYGVAAVAALGGAAAGGFFYAQTRH